MLLKLKLKLNKTLNDITEKSAVIILKAMGVDDYTTETTKTRTVYKIRWAEDRNVFLEDLTKKLQENGYTATRDHQNKTYSRTVGHVNSGNIFFVAKPTTGPTEYLKLKASLLANSGEIEEFDLNGSGKVECFTFTDPEVLGFSILNSLAHNERIHSGIFNTFKKYFRSTNINQIDWDDSVIPSEKNELGKYLGELLLGYQSLVLKEAKKFIVPNSTRHSSVDCAIIGNDDVLIPISNKFGQGARASFSPLLDRISAKKKSIPDNAKILKRLVTIRGSKKTERELVYEWGIRSFLGLKKDEVPSTIQVFKDIASGQLSDPSKLVIARIKKVCTVPKYKDKLTKRNGYSSVSSYFCYELANAINRNLASMDFLKKMLTKTGFLQANLHIGKWSKGEISYVTTTIKDMSLEVRGDKSSAGDIFSVHGFITYALKPE